jgi:hypothetical protein
MKSVSFLLYLTVISLPHSVEKRAVRNSNSNSIPLPQPNVTPTATSIRNQIRSLYHAVARPTQLSNLEALNQQRAARNAEFERRIRNGADWRSLIVPIPRGRYFEVLMESIQAQILMGFSYAEARENVNRDLGWLPSPTVINGDPVSVFDFDYFFAEHD